MTREPEIDESRIYALLNGDYRDGELTVDEAVAAYRDAKITVNRAAEACGLRRDEMEDALFEHGVGPRYGPKNLDDILPDTALEKE